MQWILCSMMECSGFYAAWPKASRLNAVDYMQHHWMQRIPCIVAQWIPIVCSGVDAARPKPSWLNAVDSMHCDWLQCIPCSVRKWIPIECKDLCSITECSGFKKQDWMQWILCSMAQSIPIECSGFHALWLNAVNCMQRGKMHPDWMQWIPCSVIKCSRFHTA